MPITTAYETRIDHVSILDEHGVFDETLGKDLIPEDQLPAIMEHLVFCRQLDETAFKLQRSGRMGTYPQNTGQEMPSLAAALAIDKADWLVTCYRENTGLFWHGLPPECILLHWMGDERGNHIPAGVNATPIPFPLAPRCCTRPVWLGRRKPRKPEQSRSHSLAMAPPVKATSTKPPTLPPA